MRRAIAAALVLIVFINGCAWIGAAGLAVFLSQEDENGKPAHPPTIGSDSVVALSPFDVVTLHYLLCDPESDPADIVAEASTDTGATWIPCTERPSAGSDGTAALATGPGGTWHVFVWDAPADLSGYNRTVRVRLTPVSTPGGEAGTPFSFPAFVWRANLGPSATVPPLPASTGEIVVPYALLDPEGDPADVAVSFSTDSGATFRGATAAAGGLSESLQALGAAQGGTAHEFVWNSFADLGGVDALVVVRVTPVDAVSAAPGTPGDSAAFAVLNGRSATVAGRSTFAFGPADAVAADASGLLYLVERFGHRVWVYNPTAALGTAAGRSVHPGQIKCVAGTGEEGYGGDHGPALAARLSLPAGLALDAAAPPNLFIADKGNHRVRRVDGATGYISTLTGNGSPGAVDGVPAPQGTVNGPEGLCCDVHGNLFIADTGNSVVRVVNPGVTAFRFGAATVPPGAILRVVGSWPWLNPPLGDGGPAPSAALAGPAGLALDGAGNLFIADATAHRVRAVNASDPAEGPNPVVFGTVSVAAGVIETVAGSGVQGYGGDGSSAVASTALLDTPRGVSLDPRGLLFLAEAGNHVLRAVHLGAPGSGSLAVGSLSLQPGGILTVAGQAQTAGDGGDGGPGTAAAFRAPCSLAPSRGCLFVADGGNRRVRAFNPAPSGGTAVSVGPTTLAAGDVAAAFSARAFPLDGPSALALRGNVLYAADAVNHRIVVVDTLTFESRVVAGDGTAGYAGDGGDALAARFDGPAGLAVDGATGKILLVADRQNGCIRAVHVDPVTGGAVTAFGVTVDAGEVETVFSTVAGVTAPAGLAQAPNGDLYVADAGGDRIVRLSRADGSVTVVTGIAPGYQDGPMAGAMFYAPEGVALSAAGVLYVADTGNHAVRVVNPTTAPVVYGSGFAVLTVGPQSVGTLGGMPLSGPGWDGDGREGWLSLLNAPVGIRVDSFGTVTFSERSNHRVRRILAGSGTLLTVAGAGEAGFNGDGGPLTETLFDGPEGLVQDSSATLYLADRGNGRVRRFRAP